MLLRVLSLYLFLCAGFVTLTVQAVLIVPTITTQSQASSHGQAKSGTQVTITHQQIQRSGATTITQVLATQSRIQLQDLTGDGSEVSVSMQGFGDNAASNVLILVDGVPQNNPDLATANLNRIPLSDVDHIEIISGSESVLYGDQAVGGVINIVTKQPKKQLTRVMLGYGSYNHRLMHVMHQQRFVNGWQYQVGANLDLTDNYRAHNQDKQGNVQLGAGYHYDRGSVDINYNYYHQYLQYAGALTAAQEAQNRRQKEPGTNNEEHDEQHDLTLHWKQLLSSHWMLNQLAAYRYYDAHGQLFGPMQQRRQAIFWRPTFEGHYEHADWKAGVFIHHDTYALKAVGDQDHIAQTVGSVFAQWDDTLATAWHLELGARGAGLAADNDQSQVFVSSQALRWQPTKHQSISLRQAGSYRFPKSEENAQTLPGVTHLKTQQGHELTVAYQLQASTWHVHADAYWLQLRNEIVFDPYQTAARPYGENRNLDPTRHIGLDLGASVHVVPSWVLGMQYSFVNAEFRAGRYKGNQVPFVAQDVINLSSQLKLHAHWLWQLSTQYLSHRFASGDDQNQSHGIPAYWLVNTGVQWQQQHWLVNLQINNLLGQYYNAYASYITTGGASTEYYYPAAGRNIMLTVSVH